MSNPFQIALAREACVALVIFLALAVYINFGAIIDALVAWGGNY